MFCWLFSVTQTFNGASFSLYTECWKFARNVLICNHRWVIVVQKTSPFPNLTVKTTFAARLERIWRARMPTSVSTTTVLWNIFDISCIPKSVVPDLNLFQTYLDPRRAVTFKADCVYICRHARSGSCTHEFDRSARIGHEYVFLLVFFELRGGLHVRVRVRVHVKRTKVQHTVVQLQINVVRKVQLHYWKFNLLSKVHYVYCTTYTYCIILSKVRCTKVLSYFRTFVLSKVQLCVHVSYSCVFSKYSVQLLYRCTAVQ